MLLPKLPGCFPSASRSEATSGRFLLPAPIGGGSGKQTWRALPEGSTIARVGASLSVSVPRKRDGAEVTS